MYMYHYYDTLVEVCFTTGRELTFSVNIVYCLLIIQQSTAQMVLNRILIVEQIYFMRVDRGLIDLLITGTLHFC